MFKWSLGQVSNIFVNAKMVESTVRLVLANLGEKEASCLRSWPVTGTNTRTHVVPTEHPSWWLAMCYTYQYENRKRVFSLTPVGMSVRTALLLK